MNRYLFIVGGTAVFIAGFCAGWLLIDCVWPTIRYRYLRWKYRDKTAYPMPSEKDSSEERRANWWKRGETFPDYRTETPKENPDDNKE